MAFLPLQKKSPNRIVIMRECGGKTNCISWSENIQFRMCTLIKIHSLAHLLYSRYALGLCWANELKFVIRKYYSISNVYVNVLAFLFIGTSGSSIYLFQSRRELGLLAILKYRKYALEKLIFPHNSNIIAFQETYIVDKNKH